MLWKRILTFNREEVLMIHASDSQLFINENLFLRLVSVAGNLVAVNKCHVSSSMEGPFLSENLFALRPDVAPLMWLSPNAIKSHSQLSQIPYSMIVQDFIVDELHSLFKGLLQEPVV
jgi:hypothetical protein